ncbi:FecR domain-containing protein [uncultured Maribacter sp.]|uniref:FecR family protein n=1 Tax=uncultured Maribacter sp. TaxID=431308 RepID=UPI0030EECED2|tara:strand:- start:21628 stop:22791 length:1164 start_codon:yes stop_codon:yes gene_type:complete
MISKDIENRIVKYFTQSADVEDLDVLNNWLGEEKNQMIFKLYVKIHFAINLAMNDPNLDKVRGELIKEIRNENKAKKKIRFLSFIKYAAIAIVFLSIGFLVKNNLFNTTTNEIVVPREDFITLELGNGEKQVITEDGTSQIIDNAGNVVGGKKGSQLIYKGTTGRYKSEFNTLSIPNGKRFGIVLSDGTKVHMNAGSSITYPTIFQEDIPRKVTLKGEAYFEVSPDKIRQFIVNIQDLDVKVYGTKFNISNYSEDDEAEVVLVEGSVSLSNLMEEGGIDQEVFLQPGYMGVFHKEDKNIVNQKVNTSLYTSWMEGNLVFRNVSFENIIQKLERNYNVVIINNNNQLANEKFNATIETKHETIEQVFKYFNKVYQIEFEIVENKIIIN